ncbi:MAG: hypothetical protein ACE5J5_00140 [Candidatus Hydrothermarchaeales archaeon]
MTQWIPEWLARRYSEMYVLKKEFDLREAVDAWGVKESTTRKILSELAKKGWIREIERGKGKRYILTSPEEAVFKFATISKSNVLDIATRIFQEHKNVLFFGSLVTLKYGHGRLEDYLVVLTKPFEQHLLEGKKWKVPVEVLGLSDTKMFKNANLLLYKGTRLKIASLEDSIVLFAYCIFQRGLALRISDYVSLLMEPEIIDWEYVIERARKFKVEKALYLTLSSSLEINIKREILDKFEEMAHGEPEPHFWESGISEKEIINAYRKVRELW